MLDVEGSKMAKTQVVQFEAVTATPLKVVSYKKLGPWLPCWFEPKKMVPTYARLKMFSKSTAEEAGSTSVLLELFVAFP